MKSFGGLGQKLIAVAANEDTITYKKILISLILGLNY